MAAIEIPIIHGTVLNPNARRMPKSATLLNSMDSLLAFPSIQRYQLQKLKEREKSSENRPKIEDLDLNDNYLKHPSAPESTYSQLNGIFSKSHGYLDTIGKYQRRYPPDQEADELATSASAYAAYERRPGQEGIDKIPHGFVSRQREIFSRQLILVEQQNESKSPSLSPLPPDTLRRKSAPTISVYVSKDNSISSTPNQTSSVSLEISSNRTSPSSISGNQIQASGTNAKSPNQDHENVERQVHESVPSSSYLIWKSQEQIQKRRGSIPNQQSHSSDAESMESRPASQSEQTFRTIIMFPGKTTPTMTTPKKMSEIVEEKPKPQKVHPKSSEFLQNIKRTVSNASTASPETMLSPRTEDTSSPGSTPDLLKINSQQAEGTQLSPATIRRNCERIMRIVQKYGCQIPEEEFDSFGESSSEASPEINLNKKSNIWSPHNFPKTDSIKHMSNQNPPEHGLHVEIPNFTKQNGFQNGHIENQIIKLKEEEIQRLQRELSDAHVCNQRLNSQLGVLASKESHITERELKKQLKERTNEVDQLKKRLEKLERDKKVLESRQPVDVQTLQGQKRELQMQLEREENEKHELFLQINQLIGQLADTRGQEPSKEVIEENQQLKDKLQILESEYQNLKNGNNTAEKSLQNAENELSTLKDELQRIRATHDLEKNRLNQEIVDYQKELQIKSAALQSLRLAKQEPKEDPAVVSRLTAENSSLKQELDTTNSQLDITKSQLADASSKLAIIQKSSEESAQKISDLTQNLTTLQIRLDKAEKIASEKSQEFERQKEEIVLLGSSKSNELSDLQRNLEEKSKKIEELTKSLSETRSSAESSQTLADEISHKLTVANHRIEDLEAGLKDKDQSYMDVENRLKTLQTELRLAKTGSESKNSELENVRGKIDELEEQLKKTKLELETVKEEKISLQDQVLKKASELELVQKDVEGFKQKIQNLEKENHRLMEKASLEEELMTLVNSLQAARTEITSKETEITELRQKLHDQQDESDRLTTELRHAQTALNHSQEENSRLAAQDIQLSDYRVESEKRLEQIRKELSDELEQARNETSQWRSEAQSLKSKSEKLEMELKEIAHMSEVRHSKSQELEVEKKRLETLLEETCEKLKDVEKQKSHESDLKAKAEDLVSSLKPLEFQLSLKTNELEATQKELASKLNDLEALKIELAKKQDKLEDLESEYLALKTVNESTKTEDAVKLAKIEADLQAQRAAKNQLDEELRETLTKLSAAETTLAIAEKAKSTLEIELTDLKQQHVLLNERVAQYGTDKISSEAKIEELKKKLSESEKELSGSSDLAKELVGVKTKLSEVEAKLEVTENNLEGVQKQLKEKEDRLKEEEAKAQGYAKMEMEIGVLRTSLGQMQTQFGVNDTEKQELKDKITELTFELEQRQVDHDKLVKSESHVNLLKQEKSELEQTLALMESKLDEAEKSLEQQMGAREEELRSQLEVLKIKLGDAEEEKKKSSTELEKAKMEYTEGLKKAQEEANDNVRRLTELLSAEAKRSENVSKEKENLQTQAENLKQDKESLQEKLKLLEAELDKKPEAVSSDDELRQKVNELMEENARLAGDLLKQQRDTSSDDEIRREYEKILLQKQQDWNRQKSALEAKLEEAATTAEKNADTVKAIKVEKEGLEEELKKLRVNGNGEPVAKPRKFTASLSNLTYDTMSERSITPSHDEEEIKKLRTELEKQKRLVTVLRKKIQQPQIEAKIQSRSSMSPIGSNGSVTPNRF